MLGVIDTKSYIIIAVVVAVILLGIQYVDGNDWLPGYIETQAFNAKNVLPNSFVDIVSKPMIWAVNQPLGAIITGIFWPFGFVWLFFFVGMQIFAFIAPGLSNVQDTYEAG